MRILRVRFRAGTLATSLLLGLIVVGTPGCGGSGSVDINPEFGPTSTGDDVKDRMTQIQRLYQAYVNTNQRPPANEEELKKFAKGLSEEDREGYMLIEDIESCFTSPRDNQPFVIQYGMNLSPGGEPKAIAWEAKGEGGSRIVALSTGYVEEYDEETFQQYK
jgi:hypothetical protein